MKYFTNPVHWRHLLKKVTPVIIGLAFFTQTYGQQWGITYLPHARGVNSIKIFNENNIVVAGGNEQNDSLRDIFKSRDGGLNWDFSENGSGPWVKSMAYNGNTGYAVGYDGLLLKTTDAGSSFSRQSFPLSRELHKIVYADTSVIFIIGGKNLLGDTIQSVFKSSDGGAHWQTMLDRMGYWLRSVAFTDTLHGVAVGDKGTILKTTDGGVNWSTISSPSISDFYDVVFTNASTGYIVGGRDPYTNSVRTILKTENGGDSWTILKEESGAELLDMMFLNDSVGYAVGDSASFFKTRDRGQTWIQEVIPSTQGNESLLSVEFLNENLGFVGGNFTPIYVYAPAADLQVAALGGTMTSTTTASLKGLIKTSGKPAIYSFYYSLDRYFGTFNIGYPATITSNSLTPIEYAVTGLVPDTTYYIFIKARNLTKEVISDTVSFSTTIPVYVFNTNPATNITINSATLNAVVNKFPYPVTLSFEYGLTPLMGNEISSNPASVSDTLHHNISGALTSLMPDTIYYFRLKGFASGQYYYGNIQSFYTGGSPYQTFDAIAASNVNDSSATLNGVINNFHVFPATISFLFGTSSNLSGGGEISATPSSILDDTYHTIFATINHLNPQTQYYFCMKAVATQGTYYSDTLTFNTGVRYNNFNTLNASNIGNTTATLNGWVDKFQSPVSLMFEYGTTTSFGGSILAIPDSINDTLQHSVSANISNLITDQLYYFRLKGTTATNTVYGETKQFYAGLPEIPNWDFQFWRKDTSDNPVSWAAPVGRVTRVPGHSGNYAAKLSSKAVLLNGIIGDGMPLGGVPFNAQPDSVSVWMDYFVQTDDTAFIVVGLKKNAGVIAMNFFPVTGNSGGIFKRVAYKLDYATSQMADTLVMGFITTNVFSAQAPAQANSNFMTVDDISFPSSPTIPNAGFENWLTYVREIPDSWSAILIGLDTDTSGFKPMVMKDYFNPPNDFAISIRNIPFMAQFIAGEAGTTDALFGDKNTGNFAVRGRHRTLNGYYKYQPFPGDTLNITIAMFKDHALVGNGGWMSGDEVNDFTTFTVPIYYVNDTVIPDSASIHLASGEKVPPGVSVLTVDKLSFDGFISGVKNVLSNTNEALQIKTYPNPFNHSITLDVSSYDTKTPVIIRVFDVSGHLVEQRRDNFPGNAEINLGELYMKGIYILQVRQGTQMQLSKIIKE